MKALCIKLCELGVPDAEAPDEADKVNHPLKMAYIKARTLETRDLAWNNLSARILALGSLLPPKRRMGRSWRTGRRSRRWSPLGKN